MTRDEYIDYYMKVGGIDPSYKVNDGLLSGYQPPGEVRRVAAPCECGNKYCKGFSMIKQGQLYPESNL